MKSKFTLNHLKILLCILFGVVTIVVIGITANSIITNNEKQRAAIDQFNALQAELTKYNEADVVSEDEVEVVVSSAAAQGSAVAKLQTQYMSAKDSDYEDIIDQLKPYFAEVDAENISRWFTTANVEKECKWEFCSTYSFSSGKIDVLWLCRDVESNDVVAYTTGIYDVKTQVFSDIYTNTTELGHNYILGKSE